MTSYQFRVIVGLSTSSHCINFELLYQFRIIVSISNHCINFESLYQFQVIVSFCFIKSKLYWCHDMACFWVIVSISSHCRPINFETFYQSWDILSISGHSIYFETLYLFQDFVFISRHRSETSYSFQESAYISVFPCHWKEAKKNLSIYLTLKTDSTLSIFSIHAKAKKNEN